MKTALWRRLTVSLFVLFEIDGAIGLVQANDGAPRDEIPSVAEPFVVEIKPLVAAPGEPADLDAWRERLRAERHKVRERLAYDGRSYRHKAFDWVPSCYCCCFAMMCDERFYDRVKRRYTADALLHEGAKEFGGYDAVVLWHAYPRIGFDDRNQFDFYRDMPGGLAGLRELIPITLEFFVVWHRGRCIPTG